MTTERLNVSGHEYRGHYIQACLQYGDSATPYSWRWEVFDGFRLLEAGNCRDGLTAWHEAKLMVELLNEDRKVTK